MNGWVRNLPDGSVEAVFKGSDDAVRRLVEWAGRGPRAAVVKDVRVQAEPPEGITGFQIVRTLGLTAEYVQVGAECDDGGASGVQECF